MMVELKRISTALGLLAALTTSALAQGSAPNANQLTADSVAGTLRASRNLAGHRIEIQARDGVVTLTGELGSPAQKAEALARTQYVAGVKGVVDQLSVSNEGAVRTVQYQPNPALAYGLGHHGGGVRWRRRLWRWRRWAPINGGDNDVTTAARSRSGPDQRWWTDARGTGWHGRCDPGRSARLSQLRMAQLCSLS